MSANRKKGLGRGLDALLGTQAAASGGPADSTSTLAMSRLRAGKYQPRQTMDEESLAELAESIRAQGVMQPLLVRPLRNARGAEAGFEIIAGERRFRAAALAGLTDVPVIIRDVDDQTALAMALIENLQREDLTALEEAQGIDRLIREFGLTHEQAAQSVGRSRSATTNLLRLLQLPQAVQQMLHDKSLDAGHARALLSLPAAHQRALAQKIAAERLSVRDAERLAAKIQADLASGKKQRGHSGTARSNRDWTRVQDQISDAIGLPVLLRQGRGSRGEIVVRFSNFDELDGVIARLVPGGLSDAS
jgi:ParB family chromosome partitioning protein